MKTKETRMLDLILHKNNLYITFALLLIKVTHTEQTKLKTPLINNVVEVHHVIVIQIETFHHNLYIVPILEIDTDMTEFQLLYNSNSITSPSLLNFADLFFNIPDFPDFFSIV